MSIDPKRFTPANCALFVERLAKKLSEKRKLDKPLSIPQICREAGVHRQSVWNWKNNRCTPSLKQFEPFHDLAVANKINIRL